MNSVETAYGAIRRAILSGEFPEGSHLREQELAELTQVSRTPVREALRQLEIDGFVEMKPNRGARVPHWDAEDLAEIFHLRALLEPRAAAVAAERIDATSLASLSELANGMLDLATRPEPQLDRVAALNLEFHELILEASANKRLQLLMRGLVHAPVVHRTFHRYSPTGLLRSLRHHLELYDALTSGNAAWAESVMRSHILSAYEDLRSNPESGPEGPRAGQ